MAGGVRMLSGALTRFVPRASIVYADHDDRRLLAMIDLDQGRIAWTATGRIYPPRRALSRRRSLVPQ
jgi:hypothetical protein